ncbi:MAG TPA: RNA polymerase sigma factor [Bryobacteraceae bacterium]|nr:RNA polymerase sigma factor [Bryobacteraceae bacterium]
MATRCLAIQAVPVPVTRPPGFEQFYQQYSDLVYRTARRITGDPSDAEDVLQTVFLRLLSRGGMDVEPRSAEAYFRRAATNASIDILRRRYSRAETPLETLVRQPSEDTTPLLRERLRRAIAGLDPEDAELFLLRSVEGWSTLELAGQFGIERGTVGSRLFRIRQALQKAIEE